MHTSTLLPLLPFLASTALAATTTTATILIPDWCITQSSPAVTVINADHDLTTYSYSCSVDSSAASSASVAADAGRSKASAALASAGVHPPVHTNNARMKRDGDCYNWNNWGFNSYSACIPWEITQGPSIWAVHYTLTNIGALDQECSFGQGGVASGPATCTASGRLDPGVWGDGDGVRTHTFAKGDVERYWIRDVVGVTSGGDGGGGAGPTTTTWTGTGAGPRQTAGAVQGCSWKYGRWCCDCDADGYGGHGDWSWGRSVRCACAVRKEGEKIACFFRLVYTILPFSTCTYYFLTLVRLSTAFSKRALRIGSFILNLLHLHNDFVRRIPFTAEWTVNVCI
jgi:hypothetical protein